MRYAIYFTPPQDEPADAARRQLARPRSVQRARRRSPPAVADAVAGRDRLPYRRGAPLRLPCDAEGALPAGRERDARHRSPTRSPNSPADAEPRRSRGWRSARSTASSRCCRQRPLPALNRFADDVVRDFDHFRAPLSEAEIERRNPDALSAEEFRNLCQWGYPYVFETFRFHMTLTGRVGGSRGGTRVRAALDEVFGGALSPRPVPVDGLRCSSSPKPARRSHVQPLSRASGPRRRKKDCLK